jgi:hypothetical protein
MLPFQFENLFIQSNNIKENDLFFLNIVRHSEWGLYSGIFKKRKITITEKSNYRKTEIQKFHA